MTQAKPSLHKTRLRKAHHWAASASLQVIADQLLRTALAGTLVAGSMAAPIAVSAQQAAVITPQAEPGGNGPRMDMAPNGTPVVKIATPTNGTSYNRYGAFNVDARGVILNNSDAIVSTQLAGYIDGNGNLKNSGPASLIINEVTGTHRSNLGGYIEIAGQKADLVLANPYGISCNGCGFLNTANVSLAAGAVKRNADGVPGGYHITSGTIEIGGEGLDASGVRLDLFARAITLNAGVWADSINASYGAGEATSGSDTIIVQAGKGPQANQPLFGLDVAALGGMYARSIRLIGTEDGLGVNVDGRLAAFDTGLVLDASGGLRIGGAVTSSGSARLAVTGALDVSGQLYSDKATSITAGHITGDGLIASGGDLVIDAGTVNSAATIAAGLAHDGTLSQSGTVRLTSAGQADLSGTLYAHDAAILRGASLRLDGQLRSAAVQAVAERIAIGGDVRSGSSVDLTGALTNSGLLHGQNITIQGGGLDNNEGIIDAASSLNVQAEAITNISGAIQSAGALTLSGTSLVNDNGSILALGSEGSDSSEDLSLDVSGLLSAAGGEIGGNGDVAIKAGDIALDGDATRLSAAKALSLISTGTLSTTNKASIIAGGPATLNIATRFNANGAVQSASNLTVTAGDIATGAKAVLAGTSVDITARDTLTHKGVIIGSDTSGKTSLSAGGALTNQGLIQANGTSLSIGAASLTNSGNITHAGTDGTALGTALSVAGALDNTGEIATNGTLGAAAGTLTNSGVIYSAKALSLEAGGEFANAGQIASGSALTVKAGTLAGQNGSFEAAGPLTLAANIIALGNAQLLAVGEAPLAITSTGALTARAARIGGNGDVTLSGATLDLGGSIVTALGSADLHAIQGDLVLGKGAMVAAAGPLTLVSQTRIDGSYATLESSKTLTLEAPIHLLESGALQADSFALNAASIDVRKATLRHTGTGDFALSSDGTLDYSGGEIYSAGHNFTLSAASLINQGGALLHAGDGTFAVNAGSFDNKQGRIATNGQLSLALSTLDNNGGTITAAKGASLTITGALSNQQGTLASANSLQIASGALDNSGGTIETDGKLTLAASSLTGAGGQIVALNDGTDKDAGDGAGDAASLDLRVTGALDGSGLIATTGRGTIEAASLRLGEDGRISTLGMLGVIARSGDIDLAGGTIDALALKLTASDGTLRTGTGGLILASDALDIDADTIDLSRGAAQGNLVTVQADALTNQGGLLQALGHLDTKITGTLDNSTGVIFSTGNAGITTGSLINDGGSLATGAGSALQLTAAGTVSNVLGTIYSGARLDLAADGFDNAGGTVAALSDGSLTLKHALNNTDGGVIQSNGALTLAADTVLNQNSIIDALGALDIAALTLTNKAGGALIARGGAGLSLHGKQGAALSLVNDDSTLASASDLVIDAVRLVNSGSIFGDATQIRANTLTNSGLLYGSTFALAGDGLINEDGEIGSAGALVLTFDTLDNRSGQIVSGDDGLTLDANSLHNDAGTLGGSGDVHIITESFDNGTGTLAAGGDYSIEAVSLTNASQGTIWGDGNGTLTLTESLTNRGSIAAGQNLNVRTKSLDNGIGNNAGTLGAGGVFTLDFQSGSLGRLVAGGDLTLDFVGDYTNVAGQSLVSLGTLTLNVAGDLTNQGRLEGSLGVVAGAGGNILNDTEGEILGLVIDVSSGGTLDNRGLINGGEVSLSALDIINTARIFGDSVSLAGTNSITNSGLDAVIAARSGLVALQTDGTITNRDTAMIYSLGHIAITGLGGTGSALSLINSSATIQAQNTILINAISIINERSSYEIEQVSYTEEDRNNTPKNWVSPSTPGYVWWVEKATTVTEDILPADSPPGRIIAGGSIGIETAYLINNASTIAAGGDIYINGDASDGSSNPVVTNQGLTGTRTITEQITRQITICLQESATHGCTEPDPKVETLDPVTTTETITVAPAIISAGGTVVIDAQDINNLTFSNAGSLDAYAANASAATKGQLGAAQSVSGVQAATVEGDSLTLEANAPGIVDPITGGPAGLGVKGGTATPDTETATIGFAFPPLNGQNTGALGAQMIDLGGLFGFAPPGSSYLVETDPAFTGHDSFLSSDYFLTRLGYDPNRTQQRLGDALYEQQLITQQLVSQAGSAQLAGYSSNEDQYRALMDAGVLYAQEFGLALGVGLSAEQMATLTSDIVLLVEVEVIGPDGTPVKVLAPRLYLTQISQKDMSSGGAIISGNDIILRSNGDITNQGVIRATTSSTILGNNILNTGRLDLGGQGVVSASNDFITRGGSITGGDVTLSAGRDLTIEAASQTTRVATAWNYGKKHYGSSTLETVTNTGASVDVSGNLTMLAGNDLRITGSDVSAGGNITGFAENGITIESALDTMASSNKGRRGRTTYSGSESSATNVLSTVTALGDITIATPGTFTAKGGTIDAGGALGVSADTITITGVTDTSTYESSTYTKKKGFLSSKKTWTHDAGTDETVIASTVSGDTVSLASIDDTSILASNVVASNGLSIASGGTLTIGTLVENDSEDHSVKVKKSGFSLGSGGLFIGVAKNQNDTSIDSNTNVGSLIGSQQGDVTLTSDKALTVTNSQIAGTATTSLTGQSITIQNATDTLTISNTSKSSSFGINIGAYENVSGAVNSITGLPGRISDGAAGGAPQTVITSASETIRSVRSIMNGLTNTAGVTASIGFSKAKSEENTQISSVVPSLISGDKVSIVTTDGDLTVTGSKVIGESEVSLASSRDAILQSAQEQWAQQTSSSSSGASIGISVGVGVVGGINANVSANVNASSSSGNSAQTTQVNTLIDGGEQLTITSERDTILSGVNASATNVDVTSGRDLTLESRPDTSSHSSQSQGINLGVSLSPSSGGVSSKDLNLGYNGGISISDGSGNASVVENQTSLIANGGTLTGNISDRTTVDGAIIAAVNPDGTDSGKLTLNTDELTVTDIADSAKSSDISIGVNASINDPTRQNEGASADWPIVDGAYASSTFEQTTKGTIGQGAINIGDPSVSTPIDQINRDIATSQIVTKDEQNGFTVYLDKGAIEETAALLSGNKDKSTILQGIDTLVNDPLRPVKDVLNEIQSFSDNLPESGSIERLLSGIDKAIRGSDAVNLDQLNDLVNDPRFPGKNVEAIAETLIDDVANHLERTQGEEAADTFRAEAEKTPAVRKYFLANAKAIVALQKHGADINSPEALINMSVSSGGAKSATLVEGGDTVVTGDRSFGDITAYGLVSAQNYLTELEEENPTLFTIMQAGMAVGKGPLGALGSYALDQAIEAAMKETGLGRKAAELAIVVGVRGLTILSDSSIAEEKELSGKDQGREATSLTMAGFTILGITSLGKGIKGLKGRGKKSESGAGGDENGETSSDATSTKKPTLSEYKAHHDKYVDDTVDYYAQQGYLVKPEVSFRACDLSGRCRADIGAIGPDGRAVIIEIKTGGASLSIRQSELYPLIESGDAIPTGRQARELGLIPGVKLKDQGYPNGIPVVVKTYPGITK